MDYREFSVSGADGTKYDCRFYNLIIGISPRHSDTADVKFLVNVTLAVVALALAAFAEHRRRTGQIITDAETIQMAGFFLERLLETEGLREDRTIVPTAEEVLNQTARIQSTQTEPAAAG